MMRSLAAGGVRDGLLPVFVLGDDTFVVHRAQDLARPSDKPVRTGTRGGSPFAQH